MTSQTKTPQELAIQRRDYQFGRDNPHPRWWMNNDPIATAFYNGLSALFPLGERFFMDSVKAFRHKTDGKLKEQVSDFLFQEAMHTREHVVFNKMATDAGYDIKKLEGRAASILGYARKKRAIYQLAATAALEHFTAMLAHAVLADPRHFADAPEEARQMWEWHAMEEIEHKAVAYDTYMAGLLERLLQWLAAMGSPVVLLSATLPARNSFWVRSTCCWVLLDCSLAVCSSSSLRITCM